MKAKSATAVFLLGLLLLTAGAGAQQLRLSLTMSPRPSQYISDWQTKRETAILTVTNTGRETVEAKLRARVSRDEEMQAETKDEQMPPLNIGPGVTVFYADQILPSNAVRFRRGAEQAAIKTGMLPAGAYELCVELISPQDLRPLSSKVCRQFSITSYQLSVLLSPENGKLLQPSERPAFRWTQVVPPPQGGARYRLKLFELLEGQAPATVLSGGIPLFERELQAQTQLIWPPEWVLPAGQKSYVWSVQCLDAEGQPLSLQDGWAEPFTFAVSSAPPPPPPQPSAPPPPTAPAVTIVTILTGMEATIPKTSLAGIVKNVETDGPVSNARVCWHRVKKEVHTFRESQVVEYTETTDSLVANTNSQGRFHLEGVNNYSYYSLRISAPSYHTSYLKGQTQYQEGPIDDLTLLLRKNVSTVNGLVMDSMRNVPMKNVSVGLYREGQPGSAGQAEPTPLATTKTSFEQYPGTFEFKNVPGGDGYYVMVKDPRYRVYKSQTFTVSDQGIRTLGTLRLGNKLGRIEGSVRKKQTMEVISGARVYLYGDLGVFISMGDRIAGSGAQIQTAGGWDPGAVNPVQQGAYQEFSQASAANQPFITEQLLGGGPSAGSQGAETPPSTPPGGSQESSSGAGWSGNSTWSPETTSYDEPELPPEKPDSAAFMGPVITDENGYFVFENVPINHPEHEGDTYTIWVEATGYYDGYVDAALRTEGERESKIVRMTRSKGMIKGKVTGKIDDAPLADVSVKLMAREGSEFARDVFAHTNPDGNYTLFNITQGTYDTVIFQTPLGQIHIVPGPIQITNSTVKELNVVIDIATGSLSGTVKDATGPVSGAMIHSPTWPALVGTSFVDGTYHIDRVPLGKHTLVFTAPGYEDQTLEVELKTLGQDVSNTVTMKRYTGSISFTVRDSVSKLPLVNAAVNLGTVLNTDGAGNVHFTELPVGQKTLTVTADTSSGADYRIYSSNIEIRRGMNDHVTVSLLPGARISGRILAASTQSPIQAAQISIDGVPGISAATASDGSFTLRNVPAGVEVKVRASKLGYIAGFSAAFTLTAGERKQIDDIALTEAPMQTLLGFPVMLDSVYESGGKRYISGAIVNVPGNSVMTLRSGDFRFPFSGVEVGSDNKPVTNSISFSIYEAPITIHGIKAKLGSRNTPVQARWIDSLNAGIIYGDTIALQHFIANWIPLSEWTEENIAWTVDQLPPSLYSDGIYHTGVWDLGIEAKGTSIALKLYGFTLTVDYTKSTVGPQGLMYTGTMKIPGIDPLIKFENLNIAANDPETGSVKFNSVTIITDPPITLDFQIFKLVDSSATWDQSGFKTRGALILTSLGNKSVGFRDLHISPEGDFLSITVDMPAGGLDCSIYGKGFNLKSVGLGTETVQNAKKRFLLFSGSLSLPMIDEPVEFQALKIKFDGEVEGTIAFNQKPRFADMIEVQLQSIQFGKNSSGKFIFLKAGVKFEIPLMSVQVGNFRFYENGDFNIEEIGASFTAGPVSVAVQVSWTNNVFEGYGALVVDPVLNVAGWFRYGGPTDWWIKVRSNLPPVPLGPFTITSVEGELGRQNGVWRFGLGGAITIGNAAEAIKLDIYLLVKGGGGGPIIEGSARVVVMSSVELGSATITLDIPNSRFAGSIEFRWDRAGLVIAATINIEIKGTQYWFVGAGVRVSLFSLLDLNASLYIAKNYQGYMHTFPVALHPDNTAINGFHLDASLEAGWGKSGSSWSLDLGIWAYVLLDWNQGLAGGFKVRAAGTFDLWIIGGSGEVYLEAAVQYVSNRLKFHGSAGLKIKLWLWPCDNSDGCWEYCFPIGGTACFGVSITIDYDSNSGWSYDVDW